MIRIVLLVIFVPLLSLAGQGCSYQNWYTGIREHQRLECYNNASPAEVQQCLERFGMDYDQYKRSRAERLGTD